MKSSIPIEEQISANLDLRGYKELTPIQNEIITINTKSPRKNN